MNFAFSWELITRCVVLSLGWFFRELAWASIWQTTLDLRLDFWGLLIFFFLALNRLFFFFVAIFLVILVFRF